MKIHYTPRHIRLTAAIRSYVEQKIGTLDHLDKTALGAHVVLYRDEVHAAEPFRVKVHVAVPGNDLHAETHAPDLYQAIDLVVEKVQALMRKHKTRLKAKGAKARKTREP